MSVRSCVPSATYRLQFHAGFTFDDAAALAPYFADLGVSHVYASPILTARAGSMHGYDVVDPTRINPELGGEAGFARLSEALQAHGLGLILDIVPNHMAVGGGDNAWWLDVLENGRASPFAGYFDIDFDAPDPPLRGKVLAPFLGVPYGEALAGGDIALIWDPALEKLAFAYGPHRFPLRREDYAEVGGASPEQADLSAWRDPKRLHDLLERQHFRLAYWRTASDLINWRRFFDITELAGLRIDKIEVFEAVHAVALRLWAEGRIDGLRIDHVDGLADPEAYCRRLRDRLDALSGQRPPGAAAGPAWVVVEKILAADEALPRSWSVDGTTGYDFMNQVSAVQHDPAGGPVLDRLWAEISGRSADFEVEETAARAEILTGAFDGQLEAAARALHHLAQARIATRDLTRAAFRRALAQWITRLRVYRTYSRGAPGEAGAGEAAREALLEALAAAPMEAAAIGFIGDLLDGRVDVSAPAQAEAARRLNQLTAPVTAKAVEDTAFYRYGRLLSRTDVGFDPGRLSMSPAMFLASGEARARDWPQAMLATATHDHKRGEDVRARLAVLSELPEEWTAAVRSWFEMNGSVRPPGIAPDDEYQLYQTLVGAWPEGLPDDADGLAAFAGRVRGWREKSLREAKLRSSWALPDEAYEQASLQFIDALLDPGRSGAFLASLGRFVDRIRPAGEANGIVQAALRCLWPGVPDLYQGAELQDLSLVDPDNRRPVDYGLRRRLLQEGGAASAAGADKLAVISRLLHLRRADPELFTHGALVPVEVTGIRADHLLAFERRARGRGVVVALPLRLARALPPGRRTPDAEWWGDTRFSGCDGWTHAAEAFSTDLISVRPVQDG